MTNRCWGPSPPEATTQSLALSPSHKNLGSFKLRPSSLTFAVGIDQRHSKSTIQTYTREITNQYYRWVSNFLFYALDHNDVACRRIMDDEKNNFDISSTRLGGERGRRIKTLRDYNNLTIRLHNFRMPFEAGSSKFSGTETQFRNSA